MTLRPNGYMPRLIDDELPLMLKSFGAVSIEGPRWCGKTWTAGDLLRMDKFFREEGCPPSVLCIVCGMMTYAYRRPDGVYVVPITSLAP